MCNFNHFVHTCTSFKNIQEMNNTKYIIHLGKKKINLLFLIKNNIYIYTQNTHLFFDIFKFLKSIQANGNLPTNYNNNI